MRQRISQWLLYKWFGFTDRTRNPWPQKCVIALAPHTSNWDFVIGVLYMWANGRQANFLMKKFWFFWPLGYIMRAIGGIPVYRQNNRSMTDMLAERARQMDTFHLCVTPEGTRRATTEWRKGFFYIAQKAGIPILVYGLDFERREIVEGDVIMPTPDTDADEVLRQMKEFYRPIKGKKPDQFAV